MSVHRLKANFTSGELSPLLDARVDNDRYRNGCKTLLNMHNKVQGPATRRSGFRFIYDLSSLDLDDTVRPRMVPFVFNETNAYVLIFFRHRGTGTSRVVLGTGTGLVADPITPSSPYVFAFTGTLDIANMQYAQSADILYITQPTRMPVEFRRLAHDNWSANEVSVTTPPFIINKTTITLTPSGTTGTITLTASATLFTSAYVGQKIKIAGGIVTITTFTSDTLVTGTVGTTALAASTATTQWYAQEWSAAFGYPRFVGFYEQRLFYASNLSRPQTIWFSKSGDYYDFSTSSPVVASDAATFTLDSGSQNKVQWVFSTRQLLIGTLGDEWSVSGSGYEPLSFASIEASRHTNHGGEPLTPIMIGPVVLFLERLGRTINQIVYDYNSNSYTTVDISILAPHLTDDNTIIDWDYQQTPNGIVWAIRDDGVLLGLTFKREHNVTGWHRHTTDGDFKSVACIPGTKETEVWTIIKRVIGGVDKYYLEKKAEEFLSDDVLDAYFLDSHLVYNGAAATTISGLDHLEGEVVDILGDGVVFSEYTVVSGDVTLPIAVERAVVGLPYTSELVPQLQEFDINTGATYARMRRIDHLSIILRQSLGLTFGRYDSEEGEVGTEEVPFRLPGDLTGTAVPLFNGVKRLTFVNGHDRVSDVFIRQTQPLPLTVIGIVDEIDIKEQ
jgi:hypothetical protein